MHLVSVVDDGANGCGTKWTNFSLAPLATTDTSGRSFAKLSLLHWAIQKGMQTAGPLALRFPPATTTQAVGLG